MALLCVLAPLGHSLAAAPFRVGAGCRWDAAAGLYLYEYEVAVPVGSARAVTAFGVGVPRAASPVGVTSPPRWTAAYDTPASTVVWSVRPEFDDRPLSPGQRLRFSFRSAAPPGWWHYDVSSHDLRTGEPELLARGPVLAPSAAARPRLARACRAGRLALGRR